MKVLVLGAGGRVGKLVVAELRNRKIGVIAFVRKPTFDTDKYVTEVYGDAATGVNLSEACKGVDAVIYCIANKLSQPVHSLYSKSTEILINNMEVNGVKRLVWLTGYTGNRPSDIPLYQRVAFSLPPFSLIYKDKFRAEKMLKNSRLDYTIVQSLLMNDRLVTGDYETAPDLTYHWYDWLSSSRLHVAKALVDEVLKNHSSKKTIVWSPVKR